MQRQRNARCEKCKRRIAIWIFKGEYYCERHRPTNAKFIPRHKCTAKNCRNVTETNPEKNVTGLHCDAHDITSQKTVLPKCTEVGCENTAIFRFIGRHPTRCAIHNINGQVPIGRTYCKIINCMEFNADGSTKCAKHSPYTDPDNIEMGDVFRKMINENERTDENKRIAPKKRGRPRKESNDSESDDPEYVEFEFESESEGDESDDEGDKKDNDYKPKNNKNKKRNKRQKIDKFEIVDIHPKDTKGIVAVVDRYKAQVVTYQNDVLDLHNKMITLRNENTILRQEISSLSETLTALIRFVNENIHKK